MSKYTTELRFLLETEALGRTAKSSEVDEVIRNSMNWLFDFTLPVNALTTSELDSLKYHFCLYFYNREIGFETVGLFKNRLMSKMFDILPFYSQIYELEHKDLNLFNDIDKIYESVSNNVSDGSTKQSGTITNSTTDEATNEATSSNLSANSDTPQTAVDIESMDYVSSLSKNNGTNNSTVNSTSNSEQRFNDLMNVMNNKSKVDTLIKEHGTTSSFLDKYLKYRDSIINVEMMIIKDCEDLFMQIW